MFSYGYPGKYYFRHIKLTEIGLPEGAEIQGLTEETDQMVISVNAPRAEVEPEEKR